MLEQWPTSLEWSCRRSDGTIAILDVIPAVAFPYPVHHGASPASGRENPSANGGFTLVELTITMAILAVLAAIAMPAVSTYINNARIVRAEVEMRGIEKSLVAFSLEHNDRFPDTLAEAGLDGFSDPWGRPYQYLKIEGSGIKGKGSFRKDRFLNPLNTDYDLYSMGPDGKSQKPLTAKESRDDIVRANNGGFIGPASVF